ncbi:MAG: DUF4921 family protein [Patescibacteria group bacterium]
MEFSQLRKDLVSGDWIVIAPKRAARPHGFKERGIREKAPVRGCIFENPRAMGYAEPIIEVSDRKGWSLVVIENKFPAFVHRDVCTTIGKRGPYSIADGVGHHDLVITRSHTQDFPDLSAKNANAVFRAFQDRYLMLMNDECLSYISIFHNWGPKAGASVFHPHYQIIAIPVVPPDFDHSLRGSREFSAQHQTCVHCTMISWERKEKSRVIFENRGAIAFTPFVSRTAFEVRVFPKRHVPFFENTEERDLADVVAALQASLRMIKKGLGDPDYNFFIHTAPMRKKHKYEHYHWHIEILPRITIPAGFEQGTGIEINPVDPDQAAALFRRVR